MLTLTSCQKQAIKDFREFINNPNTKEYILSGGAGYGKTTLVPYLLEELTSHIKVNNILGIKRYIDKIAYCATTHKAAAILSNTVDKSVETIHSIFSLSRGFDRDTGEPYFFKSDSRVIKFTQDTLLIIEESSMIDTSLLRLIRNNMPNNSKILFIGDKYQLPPVGEDSSPVFNSSLPVSILATPVRFNNKELNELNNELRKSVIETRLPKLKQGNNLVVVNKEEFISLILKANKAKEDVKIIAWTNNKVKEYNDLVHKNLFGSSKFNIGQKLVAKGSINANAIHSREEMLITHKPKDILIVIEGTKLEFTEIRTDKGVINVPKNRKKAMTAIKGLKENKDWSRWYRYKEAFAEVTDVYATTCHQSQGSTIDTVFIDLVNIMQNNKMNELLRLIYVSMSRAKNNLVIYAGE